MGMVMVVGRQAGGLVGKPDVMVSALIQEMQGSSWSHTGSEYRNPSTNCGERKRAVANCVEGREPVRNTTGHSGRTERSVALRRYLDHKKRQ